ncbi:outer membrane protein OmpK [Vibrio sp. TRT 1302]|uniref:nucleoside-specific channel-forming Tsx family protein n=1 Tax=Vibrio sp. TRT 1302 TaxID=3418504 RepID=UPI003CF45A8D
MRKSLLALGVVAAMSAPAIAADYSDGDIHKNDYKWMQFNLMGAFNEKPGFPNDSTHDYLEMEFGGRSGMFDLYGYIDYFNITGDSSSDKSGSDKLFMKAAPRMSLDALTGKDLSFGPVQEVYVASELILNGGSSEGQYKIGLGSDINAPWLGKMGLNLYSTYDNGKKDWNGFQLSTNWFKPFYFFENGSFISYQGYLDYQFGMKDEYATASNGGVMYNGIYWHSDRFAVGYGLKAFYNVYGIKDGNDILDDNNNVVGKTDSTGFAHYIAVTYKF